MTVAVPNDRSQWTSDDHNRAADAVVELQTIGNAQPVFPEQYNAVGDGVTDDTVALQNMISSGRPIRFTRGRTYLHRRQLSALTAAQVIDGNGATLKRAAQATSTTTTTITSGVTSAITLASAAGFQVGDQITVEKSDSYDPAPRTIAAIVGNVVTISGTFGISLSGTTNVRTTWFQFAIQANDVTVRDLILDGNSSNWTWARWVNTVGLYIVGVGNANALAMHCKILNQPGDGAAVINATDTRFAYNTIQDCNGRGISVGGNCVGLRVNFNRFYNCEVDASVYKSPTFGADGSNDGHGSIQLSNPVTDLLIHGNKIDTGIEGIGSISSSDNSDVTVSDNDIRNMSSFALDAVTGVTHPVNNVVIKGNRIYNCGAVQIAMSGSTSVAGNARFIVAGNLLSETPLVVQCSQQVIVQGNVFYSTGTSLNLVRLGNGGGTVGTIDTLIDANVFVGGATGILVDSITSGVAITGNRLANQLTAAISTGAAGADLVIAGNVIVFGAATTGSTNGIVIAGQHEVRNNIIDFGSSTGNNAIQMAATCTKARVIGNTCIVQAAKASIVITAGATNNELRDNSCNTTYTDGGTNTIKMGNRINAIAAMSGRAVLVAGTVTVSTGEVLTADNVLLTNVLAGGTLGQLSVGTIVNKTSFVINSSNAADTSTVYWEIRH